MHQQGARNGDFIKLPSKTRPGQYYLFNPKTGEKQWLPSVKGSNRSSSNRETNEQKIEAPKVYHLPFPKIKKNPAQDRLKRLQHNIRLDHLKKESKRSGRRLESDSKNELKDALNKEEPSTSRANKMEPSTCRANRMEPSTSRANEMEPSTSRANRVEPSTSRTSIVEPSASETSIRTQKSTASLVSSRKRHNTSGKSPLRYKSPEMDPQASDCQEETKNVTTLTSSPPSPQNDDDATHKNDIPSTSGLSIFGKLKEILSSPFSTFKTQSDHSDSELEKLPDTSSQLKADQKRIQDQNILNKSLETALESKSPQQLKLGVPVSATKFKTPYHRNTLELPTCSGSAVSSSASTNSANNIGILQYKPGSANSRLARLRQSLKLQQQSSPESAQPINSLALLIPLANTLNLPTMPASSFNFSLNCAFQLNNNDNYIDDDEIEAMDWQSIEKTDVEGQSKSSAIKRTTAETMGEIYDTVSDNLLRLSAEKNRDKNRNSRQWLKDFYYFVVDTNVLLRCLSFVGDLSQMKLCDTKGSILFVPYSVLQELDRLKMRSGAAEGTKTLAVRAIKFLNNKFEKNDLHLQAQTAIEERQHKIDVNSADDSIINCCLQVKQHVPNMVLLTEDVNLRNKAICNDIVATTKSDLMYKRYINTNGNDRQQ